MASCSVFHPGSGFCFRRSIRSGRAHGRKAFYWADVLARLKPGVTPRQVQARLSLEWRRLLDQSLPLDRFKGAQREEILSVPPKITPAASGIGWSCGKRFCWSEPESHSVSRFVMEAYAESPVCCTGSRQCRSFRCWCLPSSFVAWQERQP